MSRKESHSELHSDNENTFVVSPHDDSRSMQFDDNMNETIYDQISNNI